VCHEAEHTAFRDVRIELTPQLHAASGFALGVPHDQVGCEKCHDPRAETFAARYPGRGQDDCASCHQDPHGGQFATGPFSTAGCVGCHDRERFEPHAFSRELHERAVLPLEGRHAELECSACHAKPREDAPRVFRGTPVRCVDCHEDAHRGFFEAHGGTNEDGEPLSCSVCHGATAFDAIEPGAFDHAQRTGFAVREAHAQEACTSCHPLADEPDHAGRRFGRVSEHFGPYRGCVSCHEDPHEGAFDAPGMSAEVDGRRDCARCHQESSFRAFPDGFEHGRWTGFELKGDHAMAACTACHAPLRTPDAQGRTWARATGSACADCHDDVHQGQLARDGRTDCARCHTDGSSFELVAFDHERDARFALGEAHGQLACSACHAEEPTPDGGRLVRYRPLPTGCADCHGIHDQPLLRHRRGGR